MGRVELRLPRAHALDYLRWMAYWREVETRMIEHPALERLASKEAGEFLGGADAKLISKLAADLASQATAARAAGREIVQPTLEMDRDPASLFGLAHLIASRAEWLQRHEKPLDVAPLDAHLVALRSKVIRAIADHARLLAAERKHTEVASSSFTERPAVKGI